MAVNPGSTPFGNANFDPNSGLQQATQTYFNTNTSQSGNQNQNTAQQQANTYTPGQQSLQNSLPGSFATALGGTVPTTFTAPQAAFDAYNTNFRNYVEPGIAAQYGAGSPQIGQQQMLGNMDLAAQLYQTGQSNYLNYLNSASQYAFTPTGQNLNNVQGQDWQGQGNQNGYAGNNMLGSLLSQLMGKL